LATALCAARLMVRRTRVLMKVALCC
jgi:hypothetical protein